MSDSPPTPPTPHRIIRASAGSGKTFQLSHRYIDLLYHHVPPERILATTFTRKAAGEIQAKIFDRLAEAATSAKTREQMGQLLTHAPRLSEAECRALLVRLVRSLDRLSISTIDGFFNRIAQTFRYELDIPMDPQIIDAGHPLAMELRARAIDAMLADEDLGTLLHWLRKLHHDSAARSVTGKIDQIIGQFYDVYQAAPHRELWNRITAPAGLAPEQLRQCADRLAALGEDDLPRTTKGTPDKRWLKALMADKQQIHDQDWQSFISGGIAAALADPEKDDAYFKIPVPDTWREIYEPLIEHARAFLVARMVDRHLAIFDLLSRFAAHFDRLRRDRRVLLFSDLTHRLARHMAEMDDDLLMDIYFRLDASVGHLLLDEFQDTSLDQWAVLRPIAQEIAAHGEPDPADARSFFCVGDTKQAIYGWRGGCVELFDQIPAELHLPPNASQSLAKSYRSSRFVLDFVNQVCSTLTANAALSMEAEQLAADRFQQAFELHEAANMLPGYVGIETSVAEENSENSSEDDDDDAEVMAPATSHETHVAQRVKTIHHQVPWASVGVLVATNKIANRLIYQLREQNLTVSGEGGGTLADSPAVATILSALILADHPGDRASAFHVLNSPLGKVIGIESIDPNHLPEVSRSIRQTLVADGYAKTLAAWIASIASESDRGNLDRLEQLVELAEGFELTSPLRPSQFVRYVETTPVERAEPAPIRVMTVNKAKGLEFDIVVLPELDGRFRDDPHFLIERDRPTSEVEAVYPKGDNGLRAMVPALADLYESHRASQRYEDLCKLYVALTRAKHALHVVLKPSSRGGSLAKVLRAAFGLSEKDNQGGQTLYEAGDARWFTDDRFAETIASEPAKQTGEILASIGRVRLASPGEAGSRRSWASLSPSSMENQGRVTGRDLLNIRSGHARSRGSLMHRWFEMIGYLDEFETLPTDAELLAAGHEFFPDQSDAFFKPAIEQFRDVLDQSQVKAALSRDEATALWRERRFAVRDAGRLLTGQFDRVTLHKQQGGDRFARITDFKTDQLPAADDPGFAGSLRRRVETYRPQIQAYRRALSRMTALPTAKIQARLLFVAAGRLEEV